MGETDAQIVSELVQGAKAELEVVKRQSMVYSLYARRQKSIMVSFSPSQSARLVKWCNGFTSKLHPSTWTVHTAVGICGKFKAALSHALANKPLVCTRALEVHEHRSLKERSRALEFERPTMHCPQQRVFARVSL